MKKRITTLALMSAGLLLITASALYWQYSRAIANPGESPLPEAIGGLLFFSANYGPEAVSEVTRLHDKAFPLSSGAAGHYSSGSQSAMLWVSGTLVRPLAARMVREMEAAIAEADAEGRSPFKPIDDRRVGSRTLYELTGMGQRHFYFQSGSLVVWLAADEAVADRALAEVLAFYP